MVSESHITAKELAHAWKIRPEKTTQAWAPFYRKLVGLIRFLNQRQRRVTLMLILANAEREAAREADQDEVVVSAEL